MFILGCLLCTLLQIQAAPKDKAVIQRPKLVIGLVIDQMRPDFLYRFQDRFITGGFRRLMDQGYQCSSAYINYLPTFTGPGHAAVYTGSVPAFHGITGNNWIDRNTEQSVYCTSDSSVNSLGGSAKAGRMSPRNLWANTITDELHLVSPKSTCIGISLKDRGAILPVGHSANAAYWLDDSNGVFMSSSYYMTNLPDWVTRFNQQNLAVQWMQSGWSTLYPAETYTQSTSDQNQYEGKFTGELHSGFPHQLKGLKPSDIRRTPMGNTLVFEFARQAILQEHMGQKGTCDFLAISCSSPDYIGHQYGPNSVEIEDSYLRLDQDIAAFLEFLDQTIGSKEYLIFLTADHGVAHNGKFLNDQRIPGGVFSLSNLKKDLTEYLTNTYGQDRILKDISDYYIWMNKPRIDSLGIRLEVIKTGVLEFLHKYPQIQFAVDMQHVPEAGLPANLEGMIRNGYHSRRCGDILLILKPGWMEGTSVTGTTHGSWNPYDAHIPLIWYGWGIKPGSTYRKVYMTDIAPTLADLLSLQVPNACIGQSITEVID